MEVLLPAVQDWFAEKREHLSVFASKDSRLEGWFKGELLVLLERLHQQGMISGFEREFKIPLEAPGKRFQVDFKIQLADVDHLCELKALCISQASGTPRDLKFYFRGDRVGLIEDMKKLNRLPSRNKWLIAFIYPTPSVDQWNAAVASVPSAFANFRPVNSPLSASPELFVSLWRFHSMAS